MKKLEFGLQDMGRDFVRDAGETDVKENYDSKEKNTHEKERQHAAAEPQVSVPMREWLQAKRVELSAEQLWAVESYLVMNVLPVAPAHAAEQPKLTENENEKSK